MILFSFRCAGKPHRSSAGQGGCLAESRFDPQKYGMARERGLMQVSEKAADEWARENKIDIFGAKSCSIPKQISKPQLVSASRLAALGTAARSAAVCAR